MKTILTLTVLIGGLTGALAQGTLQFDVNLSGSNEVPPNSSLGFGSGTLTLSGNSLDYLFSLSETFQNSAQPTDVTINGPADPGSPGSLLFDLGAPTFITIQPPPGGYYSSSGTLNNLTGTEISDLESGLWYVNVFTSSGNYPDGEIRGQITPVPEPSALALLGLGIGGMGVWCHRKRS
ncbi:MAG TPA: CHRD domain-containing protein [Verrucomicrobiae bacterium]